MERIADFLKPAINSRRRFIDFAWAFHFQRLVRSLGVKFFDETVKCFLLLQQILTGRMGCFFFKC